MVHKEKITVSAIRQKKALGQKIVMLTAYDYLFADILDESGIDIILVGDSLGNVMLGYKNTLPVTMIEMMVHVQAVSRGVSRALVVADMPFGSFQKGKKEAVSCAIDLVKSGAEAVKVEGAEYIGSIKEIKKAGIPVMGHLGFVPQSVNISGYKIQGKTRAGKAKMIKEAKMLEKAGCFAVVLEMVPPELAKTISKQLKIPVIGIGSGQDCDGQVLVTYDLLGLYDNPPSFVKKYANMREEIKRAVSGFVLDSRK